jgi:hypothetical protein
LPAKFGAQRLLKWEEESPANFRPEEDVIMAGGDFLATKTTVSRLVVHASLFEQKTQGLMNVKSARGQEFFAPKQIWSRRRKETSV